MPTHLPRWPKANPQNDRSGRFLRGKKARKVARLVRVLKIVGPLKRLPREFWAATNVRQNDAIHELRSPSSPLAQ